MKGGKGPRNGGLLPTSLRIISSCLKTVSSNAGTVASTVRSAGASVAASVGTSQPDDEKDQVLWTGFDILEFHRSSFKHVLLIGYSNGFQVVDVEDSNNFCVLVSKRDGPVTFLQMQPVPCTSESIEGFRTSHPMLLVVAGDETNGSGTIHGGRLSALIRDTNNESQMGNSVAIPTPTVVRFYSLKSNNYVHLLRFRSAVYIVRCSRRIVAVALAAQIYCFDAVTLENKFSVLTYPLQGIHGVNVGYGPMAVGPRWLAYASNSPLVSNTGRLSPQNLTPSPGVSPSTSPSNGTLVARYAMESSKQLAAGIINLGDIGYKTLSKYCQDHLLPDGSTSPLSSSPARKTVKASTTHHIDAENAGMVMVKDVLSKGVIAQFRAHTSPVSALCFDPSGTLLVTASIHGHNINVFRIMPNSVVNSHGLSRLDGTSSHVHLYKLCRGLTSAVIQDISFSQYSQWISIVSSRGTCHVFTLSPFGGDANLRAQNPQTDGPLLVPNVSKPWWSKPTFRVEQQFSPAPPTTTSSVVSRIKNFSSGWLHTVSNVAASAAGKPSVPSGARTAVFHNSSMNDSSLVSCEANSLEHLLVYSPSGHIIQHELVPASRSESPVSSSMANSGSLQNHDDDLHVTAEPIQWWDVCRRSNWLERDETVSKLNINNQNNVVTSMDISDSEHTGSLGSPLSANSVSERESIKSHQRPSWYVSNAEVQISSGRIPIWRNPKISFYVIGLPTGSAHSIGSTAGEIEIEKLSIHEVNNSKQELLPALEQCQHYPNGWSDRASDGGRSHAAISESGQARASIPLKGATRESRNSDAYPLSRYEECNGWKSHEKCIPYVFRGIEYSAFHSEVYDGSSNTHLKGAEMIHAAAAATRGRDGRGHLDSFSSHSNNNVCADKPLNGESCSPAMSLQSTSTLTDVGQRSDGVIDEKNAIPESPDMQFTQYIHEGYCDISDVNGCSELTETVTDADSKSCRCEGDKLEEGDNDEMLGCVFAFSEEG